MLLASRYSPLPILLLAFGLSSAASNRDIPVPMHYQEQDSWCWAASDEMVLDYFHRDQPQCSIADVAAQNHVCNIPGNCCGSNYYACNLGCSSQIASFFSGVHFASAISWGVTTGEIDHNRPFIFLWNWDTGGSHAMVGKGYFTGFNFTGWVKANDPMRGEVAYPQTQVVSHSGGVWFNIQ